MTVKGVGFVGMRTDRLEETIALFENVIGLPLTRRDGDVAGSPLPTERWSSCSGRRTPSTRSSTPVRWSASGSTTSMLRHVAMLAAGVAFIGDVSTRTGRAGSISAAPTARSPRSRVRGTG